MSQAAMTPISARTAATPTLPSASAVSSNLVISSGRHTTMRYQSARETSPTTSPSTSAAATASSDSSAVAPRTSRRLFHSCSRAETGSRRRRDHMICRRPLDACSHSCQIVHSPGGVTANTSPVSRSITAQSPSPLPSLPSDAASVRQSREHRRMLRDRPAIRTECGSVLAGQLSTPDPQRPQCPFWWRHRTSPS